MSGFEAAAETGGSAAAQALSHHFKVLVADVTEGGADAPAGEPVSRSAPPVLPDRQPAQSLRQADLQLVVCKKKQAARKQKLPRRPRQEDTDLQQPAELQPSAAWQQAARETGRQGSRSAADQ